VGAVLLLDAWTYIWHRLNHAVPVFWRFHRVHHADARMDVTTASRFHLGEIVLSSILRIPLIVVLGIDLWELIAYETVMFAVVQLQHANIVLPDRVDRFLRLLIVTPAMHKVHHSRWRPETDSNYSSLFSFWDRIGRSFQIRKDLTSLSMGLDAFDAPENRTLSGLMKIPFSTPPHRNEAGAHPPLEA
jgi:sterol desaturase/sphingolipid hydroxylase (fatty acid hydroxylase superfamily)